MACVVFIDLSSPAAGNVTKRSRMDSTSHQSTTKTLRFCMPDESMLSEPSFKDVSEVVEEDQSPSWRCVVSTLTVIIFCLV